MLTLADLRVFPEEIYERSMRLLDRHLQSVVSVVNHNAQEHELEFHAPFPAAGTYSMFLPNSPRKIIAVRAVTRVGSISATITQVGGSAISWNAAGGTTLALTTTPLYDTPTANDIFTEGVLVTVNFTGLSGPPYGVVINLITGT